MRTYLAKHNENASAEVGAWADVFVNLVKVLLEQSTTELDASDLLAVASLLQVALTNLEASSVCSGVRVVLRNNYVPVESGRGGAVGPGTFVSG